MIPTKHHGEPDNVRILIDFVRPWIPSSIAFIVALAVLLPLWSMSCRGDTTGEAAQHALNGWRWFPQTVLRDVPVPWATIGWSISGLVGFGAGLHLMIVRSRRTEPPMDVQPAIKPDEVPADAPAGRWTLRSSIAFTALLAVLFGAGVSAIGVVHQSWWLKSKEWVKYAIYDAEFVVGPTASHMAAAQDPRTLIPQIQRLAAREGDRIRFVLIEDARGGMAGMAACPRDDSGRAAYHLQDRELLRELDIDAHRGGFHATLLAIEARVRIPKVPAVPKSEMPPSP